MRKANAVAAKNITKRGKVPKTLAPKQDEGTFSPAFIAFLVFVVVGSSVFGMLDAMLNWGGK